MCEKAKTQEYLEKAANGLIKSRGEDLANAEKLYRINLANKIQELRVDKIQATLILDIAKGDANIAELRYNRDVARAKYQSVLTAVSVHEKLFKAE